MAFASWIQPWKVQRCPDVDTSTPLGGAVWTVSDSVALTVDTAASIISIVEIRRWRRDGVRTEDFAPPKKPLPRKVPNVRSDGTCRRKYRCT